MAGKSRRPSGTSAMPRRQSAWAGTDARSLPSSLMVAALIGRRPAIALMSVVLPAPFGPTTVTRSRDWTLSDTSQTATASPWATSRCSISSISLAQIGADDVRVAHHLPWESLGDDLPVAQHDDTVGQVENGAHDVLDEDDRRAAVADLADELERVGHLRRRQPREHLVQQHQPRLGRERAGEIEELAFEQVQLVGQRVGLGFQTGEGEPGSRDPAPPLAAVAAATEHRRKGDVVDDAEPAERARDLIGAGEAEPGDPVSPDPGDVPAVERDPAAVGLVVAADDVDQRRFARAVWPDETEDLAGPNLERHAGEGLEAAERLFHVGADEQRGGGLPCRRVPRQLHDEGRDRFDGRHGCPAPASSESARDPVRQEHYDDDQDRANERAIQDRALTAGQGLHE